jgi:hypothetical protein
MSIIFGLEEAARVRGSWSGLGKSSLFSSQLEVVLPFVPLWLVVLQKTRKTPCNFDDHAS